MLSPVKVHAHKPLTNARGQKHTVQKSQERMQFQQAHHEHGLHRWCLFLSIMATCSCPVVSVTGCPFVCTFTCGHLLGLFPRIGSLAATPCWHNWIAVKKNLKQARGYKNSRRHSCWRAKSPTKRRTNHLCTARESKPLPFSAQK